MRDLELALHVFHGSVKRWADLGETATVHEDDESVVYASGGPFAVTNQAVLTSEPVDARLRVEEIVSFYRERSLPFTIQVPVGFAGAVEASKELGLEGEGETPLMLLEASPVEVPAIDGVRIERARDEGRLHDFHRAMAEGFGAPLEVGRWFVGPRAVDDEDVAIVVAYIDGEPVASSLGIRTDGGVGVYCVATVESARRRGIGEAVTVASVSWCAHDGDAAVLQASPMGKPVYERIGFRTVGNHFGFQGK